MSKRPNFSGTWRADFKKSMLEIEAPASTTFTMDHKEPVLRIERTRKKGSGLES